MQKSNANVLKGLSNLNIIISSMYGLATIGTKHATSNLLFRFTLKIFKQTTAPQDKKTHDKTCEKGAKSVMTLDKYAKVSIRNVKTLLEANVPTFVFTKYLQKSSLLGQNETMRDK